MNLDRQKKSFSKGSRNPRFQDSEANKPWSIRQGISRLQENESRASVRDKSNEEKRDDPQKHGISSSNRA